jgi:hypothetical protein
MRNRHSEYRTARHTALLIALLLQRSGKNRVRFSDKTVKKLADRERLKSAFVVEVQLETMNIGVVLVELNRGGFGAMWAKPLEGAEVVKAATLLPLSQRNALSETDILEKLDLPTVADDEEDQS